MFVALPDVSAAQRCRMASAFVGMNFKMGQQWRGDPRITGKACANTCEKMSATHAHRRLQIRGIEMTPENFIEVDQLLQNATYNESSLFESTNPLC